MKTSIPRLRRIRFKDGRTIEVLRRRTSDDEILRAALKDASQAGVTYDGTLAGFALVVWDITGTSTCQTRSNGQIPGILVPDFVRNRILAEKTIDWTLDALNGN